MTKIEEKHLTRNAEDVIKYGRKYFPKAVVWDGLDNAIVGFGWVKRDGIMREVAIYDYDSVIQCLTEENADYHEVAEYVEFNILGAYVGPHTPIMRMSGAGDSCA